MNIYEKLSKIQHELKAPKGQYNSFGKYKYRSCEDILEALKPICYDHRTTLVLSDEVCQVGERYYVKATAKLINIENIDVEGKVEEIVATAYARESIEKKGMDDSQITGTASSYARKYALNGLFNIDDTKDADTDEYAKQVQENGEKVIDETHAQALTTSITNAKLDEKRVLGILAKYGYTAVIDIKNKDYASIVNELKALKEG